MCCRDKDLGQLHGAKVVGPAAKEGDGEEEEKGESCKSVSR